MTNSNNDNTYDYNDFLSADDTATENSTEVNAWLSEAFDFDI
jgi:hypothetical protein